MRSGADKGAVSAAWGVLALVLAGVAVAVWQNTLPQGWKFPAWSAWVLSVAMVLAIYLCFASLFGLWPTSRKREERSGHETAGGGPQVMIGSPGAIQAGGRARVRMGDVLIVNPSARDSGPGELLDSPKRTEPSSGGGNTWRAS